MTVKWKRLARLITFAVRVYHQARSGYISSVRKLVYLAFGRVSHHYGVFIHASKLRDDMQKKSDFLALFDDMLANKLRDDMPLLRNG